MANNPVECARVYDMLARAFYTKLVRVGLANGANGYRSSKVMKDELEDKKGAFGCIPDGAQCIIYVMHVDPYGLERLNPDSSTLRSDRGTRQGRSTQSRYRILLVQIHVHCLFSYVRRTRSFYICLLWHSPGLLTTRMRQRRSTQPSTHISKPRATNHVVTLRVVHTLCVFITLVLLLIIRILWWFCHACRPKHATRRDGSVC